jgi:hypothetical protein
LFASIPRMGLHRVATRRASSMAIRRAAAPTLRMPMHGIEQTENRSVAIDSKASCLRASSRSFAQKRGSASPISMNASHAPNFDASQRALAFENHASLRGESKKPSKQAAFRGLF